MPLKMTEKAVVKDPDEVLDFTFDWTNQLASGATISTSTWSPETGITAADQGVSGLKTTVRLSGGSDGTDYIVTNRITDNGAQTLERSFHVKVLSR